MIIMEIYIDNYDNNDDNEEEDQTMMVKLLKIYDNDLR